VVGQIYQYPCDAKLPTLGFTFAGSDRVFEMSQADAFIPQEGELCVASIVGADVVYMGQKAALLGGNSMIRSLLATSQKTDSFLVFQFPFSSPGTQSSTSTTLLSPSLKPSTNPAPRPSPSHTFPSDALPLQTIVSLISVKLASRIFASSQTSVSFCFPFLPQRGSLLNLDLRLTFFTLSSRSFFPIYTRNGHTLLINSLSQSSREDRPSGKKLRSFRKTRFSISIDSML